MEPGCTAHMGAHMGPIWVPYRLLAGMMTNLEKNQAVVEKQNKTKKNENFTFNHFKILE